MANDNGGIIGIINTPTADTASGVWSLDSQYQAQTTGTWPPIPAIGLNSARFNDGSSDYLTRTPSTAGNRKTWTLSFWVKRSDLSSQKNLFSVTPSSGASDDTWFTIVFGSDNAFYVQKYTGNILGTNQLFRDVSAWYHIVVAMDTTQATASDRTKLYVNGSQVTSFSGTSYPTLNQDLGMNTTDELDIGRKDVGSGNYYDGYMSDVNLVDGQALDPTSFGAFNANGVWTPIPPTVSSYGTNGFRLKFENSANLGEDASPNGNNFTVNNLTSVDQSGDYPVNNFATINPLVRRTTLIGSPDQSFIDGNLTSINNSSGGFTDYNVSTLGMTGSGKYYAEVKIITLGSNSTGTFITGISKIVNTANFPMSTGLGYRATGEKYDGANSTAYGATLANGDIVGIAFDLDSGTLTFYKNGVSQGTAFTSIDASETWFISTTSYGSTSEAKFSYNFGHPPYAVASGNADGNGYGNFEYTVPSGYYSLCTKNLAEFG